MLIDSNHLQLPVQEGLAEDPHSLARHAPPPRQEPLHVWLAVVDSHPWGVTWLEAKVSQRTEVGLHGAVDQHKQQLENGQIEWAHDHIWLFIHRTVNTKIRFLKDNPWPCFYKIGVGCGGQVWRFGIVIKCLNIPSVLIGTAIYFVSLFWLWLCCTAKCCCNYRSLFC